MIWILMWVLWGLLEWLQFSLCHLVSHMNIILRWCLLTAIRLMSISGFVFLLNSSVFALYIHLISHMERYMTLHSSCFVNPSYIVKIMCWHLWFFRKSLLHKILCLMFDPYLHYLIPLLVIYLLPQSMFGLALWIRFVAKNLEPQPNRYNNIIGLWKYIDSFSLIQNHIVPRFSRFLSSIL